MTRVWTEEERRKHSELMLQRWKDWHKRADAQTVEILERRAASPPKADSPIIRLDLSGWDTRTSLLEYLAKSRQVVNIQFGSAGELHIDVQGVAVPKEELTKEAA